MNTLEQSEVRDTLLLAGGAALVVLGTGVLLAHPTLRRTLLGNLAPLLPGQFVSDSSRGGVLTDVDRYLKLRAM
jgi:hypothetical protein